MPFSNDTTAETTRIERVPGCRPRTSEFDVYVDGRVIATCSTRAEAQEVLDEYRYERLRRRNALQPIEVAA